MLWYLLEAPCWYLFYLELCWITRKPHLGLPKACFNPTLAEHDMLCLNSVDPDQLASEEANWSGSALFVIKYKTFY